VEPLGALFVPPDSHDRFWILILLLAVPTIAASLYALVVGQLPSALSYSALFLAPVFGYMLGNIHVIEESKTVAFCESCHEPMQPLVEAMRSDGTTLAGSHYQRGAVPSRNACYQCHSGYGMFGGAQAKMSGASHMIRSVTGRYEHPLRLAGTFDIQSCLNCHAGARTFREVGVHQDPSIQEGLLGGEMQCTACHGAAHPAAALNGLEAWEGVRP
jgi:cytochrome c nitrite reductase small subunit